MEQFQKLLTVAQQGDESALTELDFEGFLKVEFSQITITEELLNTAYNAVSHVARSHTSLVLRHLKH